MPRGQSRLVSPLLNIASWPPYTRCRNCRHGLLQSAPRLPSLASRALREYMLHDLLLRSRGSLQFGAWLINKGYPTLILCQTRALAPRGFGF
jgi:hypothetical protein